MLDTLAQHAGTAAEYAQTALTVIGGAATIATVTPTKKDDKVLAFLFKIVHFLAFNFGKATPKS